MLGLQSLVTLQQALSWGLLFPRLNSRPTSLPFSVCHPLYTSGNTNPQETFANSKLLSASQFKTDSFTTLGCHFLSTMQTCFVAHANTQEGNESLCMPCTLQYLHLCPCGLTLSLELPPGAYFPGRGLCRGGTRRRDVLAVVTLPRAAAPAKQTAATSMISQRTMRH